ncbi:MAG: DUF4397 domain-containing protein [Lewinellaceae bacterium]|nr:DUF4397 domain-containing protein [Saprospiraceae bacterium]MCB9336894.1 DUF4397 domain-containing protein [Lewinellaceae bacterium]
MKKLTATLVCLCLALLSWSQTARVQIIHNSPTPTVDIYANSDKLLDNFAFRTATPYIDVPAGVNINIGVALANSTSSSDAIATFPVNFEAGKTYVVVAAGVVGGAQPFNLFVFDQGSETADSPGNVGILFFHGSPDAPDVDITTGGNVLFNDVSFGGFSQLANVPAGSYQLDVTPANDNSTIVASYNADLGFWRGNTAVVFASGFFGGGDPAFEPWVALSTGGTFPLQAVPVVDTKAKVQIIHNSPDPGATQVDIYVNDDLLLDNFAFREATPFVEVPVGVTVTVGVAPANSTSAADAIATFPLTFEAGKRYIAVANGLLSGTPAFGLSIFTEGREQAIAPGKFDLAVLHGSPDAPAVDIAARGIGNLLTDFAYNEFAGYLSLDPATYYLDVKPAGSAAIVETYEANVSGLAGQSGIAIASGLLSGTPGFGIIVVLADGTVVTLPTAKIARVQVIHNSPTPTVDLWVNGDLFVNDFAFRTATPFVTVPAGVNLSLGVALGNSTAASDALVNYDLTLENGKTYVVVANGIVGGTPGFDLAVFDLGEERADADGNIGLLFFHGSPDAPEVDILANGGVAFDNVNYGEFSGYANVPAGTYEIAVTPGNDNSTVVAKYEANLGFWKGRTAVVFASGFLGGGNPGFEPWVALDNGGTFPLPVSNNLTNGGSSNNMILSGENTSAAGKAVVLYPNPASDQISINLQLAKASPVAIEVFNLNGQMVRALDLGEQPEGSMTLPLGLEGLGNGAYFLRMKTGDRVQTARFQVIR